MSLSTLEQKGSHNVHTFDELGGIVAKLRSEEGHPRNKGQTFESLKKCLADETEEVSEAVGDKDMENLCEGLGDVLLQVVLNNEIASEQGSSTTDGVIDGVCREMVRGHPHIFGNARINSMEEGTTLWNQTKMQEKARKP